jgi:hypothetical protein
LRVRRGANDRNPKKFNVTKPKGGQKTHRVVVPVKKEEEGGRGKVGEEEED